MTLIPNINLDEPHDIECRTDCQLNANASVAWCIHLFAAKYEVRLCWNGTEQYISPAANLIQVNGRSLEDYLAVDYTTFKISQASIILKHSLLGCLVQSESCNSTIYYSLDIGSEYGVS